MQGGLQGIFVFCVMPDCFSSQNSSGTFINLSVLSALNLSYLVWYTCYISWKFWQKHMLFVFIDSGLISWRCCSLSFSNIIIIPVILMDFLPLHCNRGNLTVLLDCQIDLFLPLEWLDAIISRNKIVYYLALLHTLPSHYFPVTYNLHNYEYKVILIL